MASVADLGKKQPPLIAHVIFQFSVGGLENGLVNLINHMPAERYRHAIVCLTDYSHFRNRIQRADVAVIALHKREGWDFGVHARLWQALRKLRPAIVHTRNLPCLECQVSAAMARVPGRVHGEHGRDVYDLDGSNLKYNLLRRVVRPVVDHYIAVSSDLADWLVRIVGARADRLTQIYNGVDSRRFHPRAAPRNSFGHGFCSERKFVIGSVGRMQAVKDQLTLVRAFLGLLETVRDARKRLRLVVVGDGPLREESQKLLSAAGAEHLAWLPGERQDIPEMMRALDLFVLPSLAEGISNTILEAMASGLPVVATRVGGNPELVEEGLTGMLVPPADPVALAGAVRTYLVDQGKLARHGQAGRKRAETRFSIDAMVNGYMTVYDAVLTSKRH
ncbi:MAG: TIGR03088 family PEP-CTERM/XrtA system glycosyltransferase [Acidobacteria bacterium]|nr:MAG: TIGR03088 family PEP-CTERM/XrtA system glycosyltransferase [Acidobacteriota bacterium]